jgi:Phosphoinositide 3-kinase family, accessory domain (PIK domain)
VQLSQNPLGTDKNHGLYSLCDPHPANKYDNTDDPVWKASLILEELNRIEKQSKLRGSSLTHHLQTPAVPWLDRMQRERCRQIIQDALNDVADEQILFHPDTTPSYLIFELPDFDIPILHEESFYPVPQHGASGAVTPLDLAVSKKQSRLESDTAQNFDPLQLVPILDYENEEDNPYDDKYRALAHDLLRGLVDPALKPDREQRDRLAAIIDSPSHHLNLEEKDLLWRFRFSLVDNRRALTKFLVAVDWMVESEVVQAAELLEQWRKRSPIEVTDALKLLGKNVAFQTSLVRTYAIDTLAAAPDSELRLYLLQLVQAIKYETPNGTDVSSQSTLISSDQRGDSLSTSSSNVSPLSSFLIGRAAGNLELANYLYWYVRWWRTLHCPPDHPLTTLVFMSSGILKWSWKIPSMAPDIVKYLLP